jgi:Domain of unknown function (DUF4386)
MTRTTNARVAGFAFLLYIAVGITAMILMGKASGGEGTAAKLASIAQHAGTVRLGLFLELIACFCALVLAVTLWAITRDEDPDIAMMVLVSRGAEGTVGLASMQRGLSRLWLATEAAPADPALGALLFTLPTWTAKICAIAFAVGSTCFSYLLWRGRMVPVGLAWLGLIASVLLVIALPLELVGLLTGLITKLVWIPMVLFEVPLAVWMIIKGVRGASTA